MASNVNHEHIPKRGRSPSSRLLIVANRLPVTMMIKSKRDGSSEVEFVSSSGGVASALTGISDLWIGWPGDEVESVDDRQIVTEKLRHLGCMPVFLTNELCNLFYNGFCNGLLWPLLHYMPLPIEAIKTHDKQFIAYQDANAQFAKVVLDNYNDGDTVWVHDYHLMLLPSLLRRAKPRMKIGFFFHTPFPCSEVYCTLPSRAELLRGVLSSNLIGFHTDAYSQYFQSAATRILNVEYDNKEVRINETVSQFGTYPIGIDAQKFADMLKTDMCQKYASELKSQFAGRKVLLGIDRLDYIKGILQKMLALELFFEHHPEWIGKVILVQLAVPSRTDVLEYQTFKAKTHKLVGRINGRFGSVANVPICYLDQSMPFEKMCALYHCADVMIITSIRDGMNLVSYEYIACQKDHNGVLILSEFCGAARLLSAGVLQINPWNIKDVADAIHKALTLSESERQQLNNIASNYVMAHTAKNWANDFMKQLQDHEPLMTTVPQSTAWNLHDEINDTVSKSLQMESILAKFTDDQRKLLITGLVDLVSRVESLSPAVNNHVEEKEVCISHSQYQDVGELWGWQKSSSATCNTSNISAILDSTASDLSQNSEGKTTSTEKTSIELNKAEKCIAIDNNNNISTEEDSLAPKYVSMWTEASTTILNLFQNLIRKNPLKTTYT